MVPPGVVQDPAQAQNSSQSYPKLHIPRAALRKVRADQRFARQFSAGASKEELFYMFVMTMTTGLGETAFWMHFRDLCCIITPGSPNISKYM